MVPTGRSGGERLTLSPLVDTRSPVCTALSTAIWLSVSSFLGPWPFTQPRSSSPSDVVVVGTVVAGAVPAGEAAGAGAAGRGGGRPPRGGRPPGGGGGRWGAGGGRRHRPPARGWRGSAPPGALG